MISADGSLRTARRSRSNISPLLRYLTAIWIPSRISPFELQDALDERAEIADFLLIGGKLPQSSFGLRAMCGWLHVGKDFLIFFTLLVGAAMCTTYLCGVSLSRWP